MRTSSLYSRPIRYATASQISTSTMLSTAKARMFVPRKLATTKTVRPALAAAGYTLVDPGRFPLGTTDYSSFIQELPDPDEVEILGPDPVRRRFVRHDDRPVVVRLVQLEAAVFVGDAGVAQVGFFFVFGVDIRE